MIFFANFAALLAGTSPLPPPKEETTWRNPTNSVHVRVHPCGEGMCGTVVWATDKAKADSARGGTLKLIGSDLFRDFRVTAPNVWTGKVFVPDLDHVFTGTGTLIGGDTLIARGCIARNFGCKTQVWTRLREASEPAGAVKLPARSSEVRKILPDLPTADRHGSV